MAHSPQRNDQYCIMILWSMSVCGVIATSCAEELVLDNKQVCVEGLSIVLGGMVLGSKVEQYLVQYHTVSDCS